jgi:hypothetical protein
LQHCCCSLPLRSLHSLQADRPSTLSSRDGGTQTLLLCCCCCPPALLQSSPRLSRHHDKATAPALTQSRRLSTLNNYSYSNPCTLLLVPLPAGAAAPVTTTALHCNPCHHRAAHPPRTRHDTCSCGVFWKPWEAFRARPCQASKRARQGTTCLPRPPLRQVTLDGAS